MADVKIVNEAPPGGNQGDDHYMMWRLTQEMVNAGWVIVEASDGTTKTVGSGWATFTESDNSDSWMALARPGNAGHGLLFWFRPVNSTNGTRNPSCFVRYTVDGWDTTGTTASTPPVANGTTHVVRGAGGAGSETWFGPGIVGGGDTSFAVKRMNFILKDSADDHSIIAFGFNDSTSGFEGKPQLSEFFGFSVIETEATQGSTIGDNYVFLTGSAGGTWPLGGNPEKQNACYFQPDVFRAIGPDGIMQAHKAAMLSAPVEGFLVDLAALRDTYTAVNALYLQPVYVYIHIGAKGFAKWFRIHNTGINSGDIADDYHWVGVRTYDMMWLPWDGVTATMLFS